MNTLYYPFHLCHETTLHRLLLDYETVHFREFMALQLTPLMGTTALSDRMGDYYPGLLKAGRIVQGHDVSGSMSPEVASRVNRDCADPQWRQLFHGALRSDYRFQRGLFDESQLPRAGSMGSDNSSVLSAFTQDHWVDRPLQVDTVQALSRTRLSGEDGSRFEYGFALIKTAAALIYTIRLCHQLNLAAATDSASHHRLLAQTCERDGIALANSCVKREGY